MQATNTQYRTYIHSSDIALFTSTSLSCSLIIDLPIAEFYSIYGHIQNRTTTDISVLWMDDVFSKHLPDLTLSWPVQTTLQYMTNSLHMSGWRVKLKSAQLLDYSKYILMYFNLYGYIHASNKHKHASSGKKTKKKASKCNDITNIYSSNP